MSAQPTERIPIDALRRGDRAVLARAITLIESTRASERTASQALVERILPFSGGALRIGITGIPGVGKSTLIDALGLALIERGHRVAVLAVDSSSTRNGGSILGDKTRMERLSVHPDAFVRPSPTGGTLGGVARRTRETILLCEAAGYDRILIETVGVGQSELAVDRMTDLNLLLLIGGAGDELQGIKRGIMEAADVIAITKTDGGNEARNERAAADLRRAIALLPPRDTGLRPTVLLTSATSGRGIAALTDHLEQLGADQRGNGHLEAKRRSQDRDWMRSAIEEALLHDFGTDAVVAARRAELEQALEAGHLDPFRVADELVALFKRASVPPPAG
ncbi:MAG: methylmalonyl Co-A mutase-associated GTPase MeaB [Flavobacteriales bacterium]